MNLNTTLSRIGDKYQRLVSGFGENAPDRDTLVELLTSWIVFWAKFPFEIGKRMFLAQLISTGVKTRFFCEKPLFELLGGEQLLLDALKSQVPLHSGLLNNISIVEILQDNFLPVPLIIDP